MLLFWYRLVSEAVLLFVVVYSAMAAYHTIVGGIAVLWLYEGFWRVIGVFYLFGM